VTWDALKDRLRRPRESGETLEEYLSWPKDKQDGAKDAGGFVGGYLRDGRRRRGHVRHRQLLALDADSDAPGMPAWEKIKGLRVAACLYTTRKHREEKPRYRVIAPLDRPVTPDEYVALSRVVAGLAGIDAFDDTTHDPTRLMYWPTACRGAAYLFEEAGGPPLPVDECLGMLPDWRDHSTWPLSSREREAPRGRGEVKVADPREKEGIVGAFCRCYPVGEAIGEFLNEVYIPVEGQAGRYTLAGASTSGGLVVYDDALAYSHHATDPAAGRLLNAYDLVRLHLHGHLDGDGDDSPSSPSCKAMEATASALAPVKRELLRERKRAKKDTIKAMADEYDDEPGGDTGDDDEWTGHLETAGKRGRVLPTIGNASLILANDRGLKGRFALDTFAWRETVTGALPWDGEGQHYPRPRAEIDEASLRAYLEKNYGLVGRGVIADAFSLAFAAASFNPVRDYLDGLAWDGEERLDALFISLFGADDAPYTRAVTRKIFCAAVARVYRPGTEFDNMVILSGDQGVGKSKTLSRLGKGWFSDRVNATGGKDAMEQLRGVWIGEWGEMKGLRRAEYEEVKLFIASPVDRYRPAYGHVVEAYPRQCVFFGTTNEKTPLLDPTGGRRFWIIDFNGRRGAVAWHEYLTPGTVDQLWAEAKSRWEEGETLYLPGGLEGEAREVQEEHREADAWEEAIGEYIEQEGRDRVTVRDIWEKGMLCDRPSDLMAQRRISTIMNNNKEWRRCRFREGKGKKAQGSWGWKRLTSANKDEQEDE
jgi:predicted P-loop ATPase